VESWFTVDESGYYEGRCKAAWKREFKLPWREAGPPNHHDDKVDSDQYVVNNELSLLAVDRGDGRGVGGALGLPRTFNPEPSTLNLKP